MQNEILKPVLETDETAIPRYDIVNPDGSVTQQNVELRLKNEVMQQGTPYDEESVLPAQLATQLGLPTTATPAQALQLLATKSYAKDETLSNETKTLFGLDASAVPDDAFKKIRIDKVGDTLTTARTDLGESWALCNGDYLDATEYAELGSVIHDRTWNRDSSSIGNMKTYGYAFGNGYYVAIGVDYDTKSTLKVMYKQAISDEWTVKTIITDFPTTTYGNCTLKFLNGNFVFVYSDSTQCYGYYASNPSDTWTKFTINGATSSRYIIDIAYGNGSYAVFASTASSDNNYENYIRCYSATKLGGSGWSTTTVLSNNHFTPNSNYKLSYVNGRFVFVCYSANRDAIILKTATSANETWRSYSKSTSKPVYFNDVVYKDGYYYMFGYEVYSSSTHYPVYVKTSSLDISSATITRISGYSYCDYGSTMVIGDNVCGVYMVTSSSSSSTYYAMILYLTGDSSTINGKQLEGSIPVSSVPLCFADDSGAYLIGFAYGNSRSAVVYSSRLVEGNYMHLPTISNDKTYTYMKVKGD